MMGRILYDHLSILQEVLPLFSLPHITIIQIFVKCHRQIICKPADRGCIESPKRNLPNMLRPNRSEETPNPKSHAHAAFEELFKEIPLSEKDTDRLKD
jgi:hypothetical protein